MPRYINEDDFCEYIRKSTTPSGAEWTVSKIKEMPAADVAEIKHGEWVVNFSATNLFDFYCSNCNHFHTVRSNFCSNCGADMRGETE